MLGKLIDWLESLRYGSGLLVVFLIAAATSTQADVSERRIGPNPEQLAARVELQRRLGANFRVRWDPASGCPGQVVFRPPLVIPSERPDVAGRALLEQGIGHQ